MSACLNQQPAVWVFVRLVLPIALVTLELGHFTHAIKWQVQRRLAKLPDEFARVRFVPGGRQLIINRQSHLCC